MATGENAVYTFSTKIRWKPTLIVLLISMTVGWIISHWLAVALYVVPLAGLIGCYNILITYRVVVDIKADTLMVSSLRFSAPPDGFQTQPSLYSAVTLSASSLGGEYQVGLSTADRYFEVASLYDARSAVELAEGLAKYLSLPLQASGAFERVNLAARDS